MTTGAYAVLDEPEARKEDDPLRVAEVCGTGPALAGLFSALGREAMERRCPEVVVHARADGEMDALVRRLGGRSTATYHPSGGGMGRIIDWERCIKELAPVWTQVPDADLTVATELGAGRLIGGHAAVTGAAPDIRLPQDLLLQGLVGYLGGADILQDPRAELVHPAAAPAFARLLPRRTPYYWAPDEF